MLKNCKNMRNVFLLLLALFIMPVVGDAHALWINFTQYNPAYSVRSGAYTKLYVGWGHHFPLDSYVKRDQFAEVALYSPSGKKEVLELECDKFAVTSVKLPEAGDYVASIIRKPSINTKYEKDGELLYKKGPKTGVENVVASFYSQQFAKSIICAGDKPSAGFDKILGHKLEIIPVDNPYAVNHSNSLFRVKVLLDGKPLQFNRVYGSYEGFDSGDMSCCTAYTNRDGIATLRLTHWGTWILKTSFAKKASDKDKERFDDERYYASLTFAVPY